MDLNKPKKKFGQNFLNSDGILRRIIFDSGVQKEDTIIEIGPGRGALTKHLVKAAKKVYAFEIDTSLKHYLDPIEAESNNLSIVYEDILEVDLEAFIKERIGSDVKVIANIPYYITSPIIFKLLEIESVKEMTLLIQKEVADRLASSPNSKDYSGVSVIIQALASVDKLFHVKRTAFYPVPNVDSTVIKLTRHQNQDNIHDAKQFTELVKASFKQKRKTLLNNLEAYYGLSKADLLNKLKKVNEKYDQFTRAEGLSLDDFIEISNRW